MPASAGVARAYAKALFALARERNQTDVVARELGTVVAQVREPALAEFFARPWVTAAAKRGAAEDIARRLELSMLTRDFLALVAAHGRVDHLEAIAAAYAEMLDADQGRVRARVRAPVALTDVDRATLAAKLGRALGGKRVMIEDRVDPTLLGGFVAEIGSLIVDGSLDGQLARMKQRLVAGG